MATYRFPSTAITGIVSHILAYDLTILSMTPDNDYYVMELNGSISESEVVHLNEEYGLTKVT